MLTEKIPHLQSSLFSFIVNDVLALAQKSLLVLASAARSRLNPPQEQTPGIKPFYST